VPDCVRSGEGAAEQVLASSRARRSAWRNQAVRTAQSHRSDRAAGRDGPA